MSAARLLRTARRRAGLSQRALAEAAGVPQFVADIDDLIRMKLAAARPKDLIEAEVLGALREELATHG